MKIYIIGNLEVTDRDRFLVYSRRVRELVAECGARFLVRGGDHAIIQGDWPAHRLIVIEFPSREVYDRFNASDAYQAIIPIRLESTRGSLVVVDGVPDAA